MANWQYVSIAGCRLLLATPVCEVTTLCTVLRCFGDLISLHFDYIAHAHEHSCTPDGHNFCTKTQTLHNCTNCEFFFTHQDITIFTMIFKYIWRKFFLSIAVLFLSQSSNDGRKEKGFTPQMKELIIFKKKIIRWHELVFVQGWISTHCDHGFSAQTHYSHYNLAQHHTPASLPQIFIFRKVKLLH